MVSSMWSHEYDAPLITIADPISVTVTLLADPTTIVWLFKSNEHPSMPPKSQLGALPLFLLRSQERNALDRKP